MVVVVLLQATRAHRCFFVVVGEAGYFRSATRASAPKAPWEEV